MKTVDDILLIGDPRLYEQCMPISKEELSEAIGWADDLHDVLFDFRAKNKFGRGIAAPQLGIMKQLIYIYIDQPLVLINPEIIGQSEQLFEIWDDCMSIPNLLVRVNRNREITVKYKDLFWKEHTLKVTDPNLSELMQHEIDHLSGILCTMRAIDNKSFKVNDRI
jgi:peptide deformylase